MQNSFRSFMANATGMPIQSNTNFKLKKHHNIKRVHLIDAIYQGDLDISYQRDGFGILQTSQFQTYIGYHRYNKMHGVGLIIFQGGQVLYGTFANGELLGIALTDNGIQIQIGTFKQQKIFGIGYEYNYVMKKWKMNKYHKGVAIEVITQQSVQSELIIPKILLLEEELYDLFTKYKNRNFFDNHKNHKSKKVNVQNLNEAYLHQISNKQWFFGLMADDLYEGIGLKFDPYAKYVTEAGMYRLGKLNGYGMKRLIVNNVAKHQQLGLFIEGKEDGIVFIKQQDKNSFLQYKKGILLNIDLRRYTRQQFQKNHKIFNYRQRDFLSQRHGMKLDKIRQIFESNEYKAWKLYVVQNKNNKKESEKKMQIEKKKPKSPRNLGGQLFQRSSVLIMREKIQNLVKSKKSKLALLSQANIQGFDNSSMNEDKQRLSNKKFDNGEDQIARQQIPIQRPFVNLQLSKSAFYNISNQYKA